MSRRCRDDDARLADLQPSGPVVHGQPHAGPMFGRLADDYLHDGDGHRIVGFVLKKEDAPSHVLITHQAHKRHNGAELCAVVGHGSGQGGHVERGDRHQGCRHVPSIAAPLAGRVCGSARGREMVHRPMGACTQIETESNRVRHVTLGQDHGVEERPTKGQVRCQCG